MDWARAIERNGDALRSVVATLFALLGLVGGVSVERLPKPLYRAMLRLLYPAEAALRRLIIIAARGLVVKLPPSRPAPQGRSIAKGSAPPPHSFQLFDARKRFALVPYADAPQVAPRGVASPRGSAATPVAQSGDGEVDAKRLCRRLQALALALDNLPQQAKRLARWRARRERMVSPKFRLPLRPGPPPGYRKKPEHEIDQVLIECHGLAWDAMRCDTS